MTDDQTFDFIQTLAGTAHLRPRQREILDKIPVYKTGGRAGTPRNEQLREIDRMLRQFPYTDKELAILEAEIEENRPKFMKRARAA